MNDAWHRKRLWFLSASREEQIRWLARLLFKITIFARGTYEEGTENLTDPSGMRRFNELMHRVSLFQLALINDDPNRYPDEIFFKSLSAALHEVGLRHSEVVRLVK